MRQLLPILLAPVVLTAQAPVVHDAKAEAVIQKHLQVRGGLAKLKALKTLRLTGWQLLLPDEVGIPWRMEQARPNRFREEVTVQGMVEVHTFDGTQGWTRIPWAKDRAAQPLKPEQIEALKENDFDDPWIGALDHPADLHYQGPGRFNGVPVLVVQWSLGTGDDLVGFFDQEVGLEIMRERIHREMGMEAKLRSEFQQWRTVKGLAFPFEVTHRAMGRGRRVKIQLETVEVDPVLPESRFGKP